MCEIRMSKVPPLLLEKRAMTGLLSQNLFCHLQANGKCLTILESLKKKKGNKQGCFYELTQQTTKGYSFYGVHSRLLPQTSSAELFLLSSSPLFLPGKALALVYLGLFLYHYLYLFYHASMFNSRGICAWVALIVRSTRDGENYGFKNRIGLTGSIRNRTLIQSSYC